MKNNTILGVLTLLSIVLLFLIKPSETNQPYQSSSKKPQEYMMQLFVTLFNESGAVKNKLSANYWGYLPEKGISTLTRPHLTLFKPDGVQWFIHSKKGHVTQPNIGIIETITLQENVILERPASDLATAVTVETESLSYQPKKDFAESDDFVRLIKPGVTITGIGLRAPLDKGSVELLSHVKTYYLIDH